MKDEAFSVRDEAYQAAFATIPDPTGDRLTADNIVKALDALTLNLDRLVECARCGRDDLLLEALEIEGLRHQVARVANTIRGWELSK